MHTKTAVDGTCQKYNERDGFHGYSFILRGSPYNGLWTNLLGDTPVRLVIQIFTVGMSDSIKVGMSKARPQDEQEWGFLVNCAGVSPGIIYYFVKCINITSFLNGLYKVIPCLFQLCLKLKFSLKLKPYTYLN